MYEYELDAQPTISFIWVTTVAKHFVKLRMSLAPRLRDEVPDARRAVLSTLLLTAVADKSPELTPVCGGEIIPGYETELDLYRGMITINDEGATTRSSKLLAKADKAGFLDELVWVEVHRESWGTVPPEGLTLLEYEAWRKKNLKRFKAPNFGSVTVQHPRPLPPEPPAP